jgi:tetraacyldisaccharide 4'-kinase
MRAAARFAARSLVPLYAAGIALKNSLYDHDVLHAQRLTWPVVSIGNLSVGGTGKTPFVLELAQLLQHHGWSVDVLSRGYGRSSTQVERVSAEGSAQRYGDEPLMMARRGLDVYVGRRRYDAGRLAEEQRKAISPGRAVHLLDDGLQHRELARTVDIALLERRDLTDWLLPAGRLREPRNTLRRVDICVLREEDRDWIAPVMDAMQTQDAARIWFQQRRTIAPVRLERAIAFCGLGNAAQFFSSLRQAGISPAAEVAFPDHHGYREGDIDALAKRAQTCRADGFVTTEKDSMRLEGQLLETLEAVAPVHVAKLAVALQEPERCMRFLEALLDKPADVR